MPTNCLHRLDSIEERLGLRACPQGSLCYRCEMAKLHADLHGEDWGGCDGRPSRFIDRSREPSYDERRLAIADLADAELEQAATDLRILIARQEIDTTDSGNCAGGGAEESSIAHMSLVNTEPL